jgi:ABC-type uncharacterized transport system substrate-binding protein
VLSNKDSASWVTWKDHLAAAAADLVRLKVDVLVAFITEAALAAKKTTTTIPIVMANVGDPVESGLAASLARPGGNVTGLSRLSPALIGKNLELLKEAVPETVRVVVLSNPANSLHAVLMQNVKSAASSLGVQLKLIEARAPNELERAFSTMAVERAGAVLVLADGVFFLSRGAIAGLALKNGLPSMFGNIEHVEAGGLMSWAANSADNYRRAAIYVDKILKGAKAGDLPIEQPAKFELVINLKTAKALGLIVPSTLLARADQVIE